MLEAPKRLLKIPCGFLVGRARHRFGPCLLTVEHGLLPRLPPQGMVREAFRLLGHAVAGGILEGLDDPGMQRPPPFVEQAAVGHLVRQGVLEGVDCIGRGSSS